MSTVNARVNSKPVTFVNLTDITLSKNYLGQLWVVQRIMASTSKDQQKGKEGKTLPIINAGGDHPEEEAAVPFSVTQALQNDLVLDNIFSYLSVPDLKACRQVCQQWKLASRRSLVEKCNRVGFFGRSVVSRTGFKKIYRIEDMAKLSSVISTSISSEFPVTKFRVETSITDDGLDKMDGLEKILREFFEAIGPLATQLEIGYKDASKLFQLDAPLNVEFPRLKTLKASSRFRVRDLPPVDIIRSNPAFFQNILENAPQVSTLYVGIGVARPETLELFIKLMERVVPKLKISTLQFHSRTALLDNHFHRLANIDLKLTSLRLNLVCYASLTKVGEGWMKFMESQSETLEELFVECDQWEWSPEWTVEFPRLRKLKRLTIGTDSRVKFSGIYYTRQFPSLQQLSLTSNHNTVLEAFLNSDLPPVETVEILELLIFDQVWIWHAARIFPNVRKLKIPGWTEILQVVFQAWQNVEELTIRGMGWCGASANELLALNFQGVLPASYYLKTSGMPAKFLQELKSLRLENFYKHYLPTTLICHFVLLKMGSLKCLDLSKCIKPESKISDSMLSKMRKKFLVLC